MSRLSVFLTSVLFLFVFATILLGQQDTTLTITSEGKVGIGITIPLQKLHVAGGAQFDKVGPEGRLILRSVKRNDPGRFGIRFLNNEIGTFEGEDIGNQIFGFFSGWGWTRQYDAVIEIHGKSTNNWGKYLRLTHDGTDGFVSTDAGDIILNPSNGKGNVGIGVTNPITKLEVSDIIRVRGWAWPNTGKGMELAYNPGTHRGFIQVFDRDKKLWGNLYLGNGTVGIGILDPTSKLHVNGTIASSAGGFKFPDGTVQTTAASGGGNASVWKQVQVKSGLTSTLSDKASIQIKPPSAGGYFVLTLSGMCSNLQASNKTRFLIYLNNVAGSGSAYPGYISYYQDSSNGFTRQVPVHATRFIANSSTATKTFYVYAGDNFDGGYELYGMFTVQWLPGSQQK